MASQVVSQFADALDRHGVELVRTTPQNFAEALDGVVTDPAVGTELPDPLGYEGTTVETDPTVGDIETAATGVTHCPLGIASYGSVVVRGSERGEEPVSLFADHHVAFLTRADLVPDVSAAIAEIGDAIRNGHGDNVVATGPSATADMGELVVGAHGPKRVTVLFAEGLDETDDADTDGDDQ